MHKRYWELLGRATREVFETMPFMDLAQLDPIEQDIEIDNIDVTGMVCLAGEISGMLAVHCDKGLATECFMAMSGGKGQPTNMQVCDTVGELANMIAGTLKRHLSAHVDLFDLSLPCVSLSEGQKLFYRGAKRDFPRLLVPFLVSEEQKFYVELLYHKR